MPSPKPLITHIYTADPSAHVFNNTLYLYPSHDRETSAPENDNGDQYDMTDYHVFSISSLANHIPPPSSSPNPNPKNPPTPTTSTSTSTSAGIPITDHGPALTLPSIPWATTQLWAPDCAFNAHTNLYHLFFPARDHSHIFRIGTATSPSPSGPFTPDESFIPGIYSIDPTAFVDDVVDPSGSPSANLYFGGIWGGQLQCWKRREEPQEDDGSGELVFDESMVGPQEPSGAGVAALCPRVARLRADFHGLAEPARELRILAPETGELVRADDHERRYFEGPWVHKYGGRYHFSYSTGDTHFIVYAVADSPYGPFMYRGRLLEPVEGWTTHHSIVEFEGRWWLFYHDASLSGGTSNLRCVKVREIVYDEAGDMRLAESQ